MALDFQMIVTKDALPSVTINPPDLSNAEEAHFVQYLWTHWPVLDPETGVQLARTNQNTAIALRNWGRAVFREQWGRVVEHKRQLDQTAAREAVTDFSGKADQ